MNMGTDDDGGGAFWTFCPYCFYLYSYDKIYEGCCLRCQNSVCRRAFQGVCLGGSLPRMELDKGVYFGCFGFFPLGFSPSDGGCVGKLENWSPIVGLFPVEKLETRGGDGGGGGDDDDEVVEGNAGGKKRKMTARRKTVAWSAKKLRTKRRVSDEGGGGGGGGYVGGERSDSDGDDGDDGDDDDGGGDSGVSGSNIGGGSGYGRGSENMDFFEEDGEIFVKFGPDDV